MHVHESISYDAPVAEVLAMLADPAFQQQVTDRSHPLRSSVDARTEPDGSVLARVERTHDAQGLGMPSAVRLDEITLVQEQRWAPVGADGTSRGTITVQVQGLPVSFTGDLVLAPQGDGSTATVDGDLVAKVPLVGGKIEKAAAPAVLAAIRTEASVGREWLAAR